MTADYQDIFILTPHCKPWA